MTFAFHLLYRMYECRERKDAQERPHLNLLPQREKEPYGSGRLPPALPWIG